MIAGLDACSTVDNMNYMDRNDLIQARGTENIDGVRYMDYGNTSSIKSLGALKFKGFDEDSGEPDDTVIDLKRNKSRLYAETPVFESDNKDKSTFDKGLFNFGIDKKSKGLGMELSLQF